MDLGRLSPDDPLMLVDESIKVSNIQVLFSAPGELDDRELPCPYPFTNGPHGKPKVFRRPFEG